MRRVGSCLGDGMLKQLLSLLSLVLRAEFMSMVSPHLSCEKNTLNNIDMFAV